MFLNKDSQNNKSWLLVLISLAVATFLLTLSSLEVTTGIESLLSYILDPIYSTSANTANGIGEYFSTLVNISDFRDEYNQMKVQISTLEVENLNYQQLLEENIQLKTQLELGNKEYQYVEATILNHIESDYILINAGSSNGIQNGDVVVLGNSFLGIIMDINQYSSKVRLPISKSTFLEAYIVDQHDQKKRNILSKAVVNGSADGIKIENIGMNSGVENGDIVVVNDQKVGDALILGTVVGLSQDPATTTRSGYVSPVVDYYDLINVFVRIKDVN